MVIGRAGRRGEIRIDRLVGVDRLDRLRGQWGGPGGEGKGQRGNAKLAAVGSK
jgi:hypothetical protein